MKRDVYSALPQIKLAQDVGYVLPDAYDPQRVRADTPAIEVMTDLRRVPAATIGPDTALADANQAMILRGVRSLLVTTDDRRLVGLVTSADVLGEKPLQVVRERGLRHEEVVVRDVMTPSAKLDALDLGEVLRADVGHVLATLRSSGRQHALVTTTTQGGRQMIRGIFSASQIARQLGIALNTTEIARSFAEIEAAIAGQG
jgi:CBS-domain-containing membrane protein